MKPENLRRWTMHFRHISDVLVSRIDLKLCQIYTNIHVYEVLYKICSKTDLISQIRNQSNNDDIPQKTESQVGSCYNHVVFILPFKQI